MYSLYLGYFLPQSPPINRHVLAMYSLYLGYFLPQSPPIDRHVLALLITSSAKSNLPTKLSCSACGEENVMTLLIYYLVKYKRLSALDIVKTLVNKCITMPKDLILR